MSVTCTCKPNGFLTTGELHGRTLEALLVSVFHAVSLQTYFKQESLVDDVFVQPLSPSSSLMYSSCPDLRTLCAGADEG